MSHLPQDYDLIQTRDVQGKPEQLFVGTTVSLSKGRPRPVADSVAAVAPDGLGTFPGRGLLLRMARLFCPHGSEWILEETLGDLADEYSYAREQGGAWTALVLLRGYWSFMGAQFGTVLAEWPRSGFRSREGEKPVPQSTLRPPWWFSTSEKPMMIAALIATLFGILAGVLMTWLIS